MFGEKLRNFILLGTEEKVGKTYVGTLLMNLLYTFDYQYGYMKFAEVGVDSIERSATAAVKDRYDIILDINDMLPYCYSYNMPVHLAGRKSNNLIDADNIQKTFAWNVSLCGAMIVEGVQDVVSPLVMEDDRVLTQVDLISKLNLSPILVVRMSDSAINHASLASYYLKSIGLDPVGIIINGFDPTNEKDVETYNLIEYYSKTPIFAVVETGKRSILTKFRLCDLIRDPN